MQGKVKTCRGSGARVALTMGEQIHREKVCEDCGRVLRLRVSERTGQATLPRHHIKEPRR